MYDRHLETFIQAADSGSFLKASEKLYISANAITKQINLLEERLDVKLFSRSTQGLELTEAGKLIYAEAKKMIRHSNSILKKAKELENRNHFVIHIGVSLMNPASILLKLWHTASQSHSNIRLDMVPFEDTASSFNGVLDNLGKKIDLILCPCPSDIWGDRYNFFHLKDLPLCITCSMNHRLAAKKILTMEYLYGETLILPKKGRTPYMDPLRDELEEKHPQIHIRSLDLELSAFNQIVSSDELIVSAECWKDVHPLLVTLPVRWNNNYVLPHGLLYAKEPSREVLQFIMSIGLPEAKIQDEYD